MQSISKREIEFLKRKDGPTARWHAVLKAFVVVSAAAVIAIGAAGNFNFTTSGPSTIPN